MTELLIYQQVLQVFAELLPVNTLDEGKHFESEQIPVVIKFLPVNYMNKRCINLIHGKFVISNDCFQNPCLKAMKHIL